MDEEVSHPNPKWIPGQRKFAARITYLGTGFCGWQKQLGAGATDIPSIQDLFEKTLNAITGETPSVVASGRTDSGVHAAGQVVHFRLTHPRWTPHILLEGLNSRLAPRVQVRRLVEVPMEFHAQRSSLKKQYSYYFLQGPCAYPFLESYTWWIRRKLDLNAMQRGLACLVGEHDFKAFQGQGGRVVGTTVRTLYEATITKEPIVFPGGIETWADQERGHLLRLRLVGSGFLKQMVRGIAGTLLQVGDGRRPPECFREILESQNRRSVGPTAPGKGLWLEWVEYPSVFDI